MSTHSVLDIFFRWGSMGLDVNTLFQVTISVEAMLGLLLLFAWVQNASIRGVAWWGFAHLLGATSIVLFGLYGSVHNFISIDIANAMLFTAAAMTWTGARVFDGRSPKWISLFGGAFVWIFASRIPAIAESVEVRVMLSSAIIAAYTWMTAYEFWRGREEPLVSRWPAILILFAHGAQYLLRSPLSLVLPWSIYNRIFDSVWMTVLSFESLLFTIAIAFILLAMAKERTEYLHRTASLVDPLTGLPNRRAFLEEGTQFAQRCDPRPAAVLLIDLDHFKSINDRFGHGIGDRVLQVFAQTAIAAMRPCDFIGRLGGEEFAAVLYDVDREKALAIAELIRSGFADNAAVVEGRPVTATISIGLVLSEDGLTDVPTLLAQADQALYYAKERGRNRTEIASLDLLRWRDIRVPAAASQAATGRSAA